MRSENIPRVRRNQQKFARFDVELLGHVEVRLGGGLEALDIVRGEDGFEGVRNPGVFELSFGGWTRAVGQRHHAKTGRAQLVQ